MTSAAVWTRNVLYASARLESGEYHAWEVRAGVRVAVADLFPDFLSCEACGTAKGVEGHGGEGGEVEVRR